MNRYFILDPKTGFSAGDQYHLKNVMRHRAGDLVEVVLDQRPYLARLTLENQQFGYSIEEPLKPNCQLDLTLIQGLPKGNKIDEVIRLASYFGIRKIILVPFMRSIAKATKQDTKLLRLEKIAQEAVKLAHFDLIPQIEIVESLKLIDFSGYDQVYVCDELEQTQGLKDIRSDLKNAKCAFIIGPEGGITNEERNLFDKQSFTLISLGKAILPTELALVKFASIFNAKNE